MPIETADLLTLTQWLSPSYPVGAFSYSHGLENLIAAQQITSAAELQDWLEALLTHGSARSDAVLLAAAYRAEDPAPVLELAEALCPTSERLSETMQQGAAFTRTTNAVWQLAHDPAPYPVAVALAARSREAPLGPTLALYVHAFISNLVGAATRLIPLGQTEAHTCLAALAPAMEQLAADAQDSTLEDLGTATFAFDIAAMRHEIQPIRLFQS